MYILALLALLAAYFVWSTPQSEGYNNDDAQKYADERIEKCVGKCNKHINTRCGNTIKDAEKTQRYAKIAEFAKKRCQKFSIDCNKKCSDKEAAGAFKNASGNRYA